MRDRIESSEAPLLYRAVVACNFRESKICRKELREVQQKPSSADDAYEATSFLANIALAEGHYGEALTEVNMLLHLRPSDTDAQNAQVFFGGLAVSGDQQLMRRKPGTVPVVQFDGNVGAPLKVNGHATAFIFDTGANVSVISDGQAKLMGLAVHDVKAKLNVATGAQISFRIADADTLLLGNVELRHVAFLVVPDTAEPFVEMPEGRRGILGLPVLLAAETLRMHDSVFDIAYKPATYSRKVANICAYGPTLSVQLTRDLKSMNFALDTGAVYTDLYTPFAKAFPDLIASGKEDSYTQHGIGSEQEFPIVQLRPVEFDLGGQSVTLSPARVLMKPSMPGNSDYFYGNLGMDLLSQGKRLAFDFRAMQLTLR